MALSCHAPALPGAMVATIVALTLSSPARSSINVPSDGSDGAFAPTGDTVVDLTQAITGSWNSNNASNAGKGIYDPAKWAIVFKYTSVNIPAGVRVSFKCHPSNPPVVWLVQGDVTIAGTLSVDAVGAAPGPGGFRGSKGTAAGLGPGSAPVDYRGSYGCVQYGVGIAYGNEKIVPLIGGSGAGKANYNGVAGGPGGGAILIASGQSISVPGSITALCPDDFTQSTGYSGAPGAIRLVADVISVPASGSLSASQHGGALCGRIRLEGNSTDIAGSVNPGPSRAGPMDPPQIWPSASAPTVSITRISGMDVPADPRPGVGDLVPSLSTDSRTPVVIQISAAYVPLNWNLVLRVVPTWGDAFTVNAVNVSGDETASSWQATIPVGFGLADLQVRASQP